LPLISESTSLFLQAERALWRLARHKHSPAAYFGLTRYNPNGTLDASFRTGGTVTTDFAGDSDGAQALAVQADGKLVAAGAAGPGGDLALARYRTR
jgi:hypothetical protein